MNVFRWSVSLFIVIAIGSFSVASALVANAQTSGVTAEPLGQANLRAQPDTASDKLGEIFSGTRYPVIGRSEFFPWVLVADPNTQQALGWVFNDLMAFQGDPNTASISTLVISASMPVPTQTLGSVQATQPAANGSATLAAPVSTSAPPTAASNVTGFVNGEIYIRYGPGTEYERIGVANAGDSFPITGYHTQLPWVQIAYSASPTGYGWILRDLLEIQGDVQTTAPITQTSFLLPTLTPTPSIVQRSTIGTASPEFEALGAQLWDRLIEANFDPQTSRVGSLFLMNLKTGETIAFDANIAFSGMSLNKIAILVNLFSKINDTPDDATAVTIGEAMICSENISSNKMLSIIGDGNPFTGASRVSEFYAQLGLENSFIYTPFANDPFITPQAPETPRQTTANQIGAEPDPYNQMTVTDMGMLLHAVYQCAVTEDGPLIELFSGAYTPQECRKIIDVMSNNRIHNFMEAGVPEGVRVAHKHGWVADTHGDAGIVFTPAGDFIFVIALHNPVWMEFSETVPVISESTRDIYNYLNPDAPLEAIHPEDVPECNLLGNPAINDLLSPTFGLEPLNW